MKALLLIFVSLTFLYSQDMDALLSSYATESELSKKTKDESAGNLIVYTRDDLERMQVESLKDILKSLRFFQYAENRIGQPDILNQDPLSYYSKGVRIYLNEHELLSSLAGSGLLLFGDMEMDFIDHVEIYQGFPSFDLGIEPATIVIRLYSKSAEHDEGGRVKAMLGSYGKNKQNVYYSEKTDDLSYFFYANRTDDRKDTYEHDGETLKRDLETSRFYALVEKDNHTIEFHAMKTDGDAFMGSAMGNIPHDTSKGVDYLSLSTNSKFFNDSLIFNMSYINSQTNLESEYAIGKPIFMPPATVVNSYEQTIDESSFTTSLKKEWELDIHTITAGIQYRYKQFDITDLKLNGIKNNISQVYNEENIYSIFLEDKISINENNLITISLMDQEYVREDDVSNQNTIQLRIGHIYTNDEWVSKTFASVQEFASEPYMTISPNYGNQNLDKEKYSSITQELTYTKSNTITKVLLTYGVIENLPIIGKSTNPHKLIQIKNSKKDLKSNLAALEFTYLFSEKDKLELQANYFYMEPIYGNTDATHFNYLIRMVNTVSKFDIFNELVIKEGYNNVDTGYDYSLGIKYEVNEDLHINFKGVNIFDSALEWDYTNKVNPATFTITDSVIVPTIERQFLFGLEYLF